MDVINETQEEEHQIEYKKMLGLHYISRTWRTLLNMLSSTWLIVSSIIYLSFLLFVDFPIDWKRFMLSQYLCWWFWIISLRTWWIYNCRIEDTAIAISWKIIISSFIQFLALLLSISSLMFLNVLSSKKSNNITFLSISLPYLFLCLASLITLANITKLVLFLILLLSSLKSRSAISSSNSDSHLLPQIPPSIPTLFLCKSCLKILLFPDLPICINPVISKFVEIMQQGNKTFLSLQAVFRGKTMEEIRVEISRGLEGMQDLGEEREGILFGF